MNNGIYIEDLSEQVLAADITNAMLLAAEAALEQHCACKADVFISITGADEMQRLNNEARGVDSVTDVLSFPYVDFADGQTLESAAQTSHMLNPDTGRLMLGDIIICIQRAAEQAEEYNHTLLREMSFLTVHGLLHLLGYDHEDEAGAQQMFALQDEILSQCNITR